MKKTKIGNIATARAEQVLIRQLPVEQKTLRRVGRLMEPKNLKRLGLAVVGGSMAISLFGTVSEMRMYRRAMARELRKQLEPVNRKLDELEKQNEELRHQNEQLRKSLDRLR